MTASDGSPGRSRDGRKPYTGSRRRVAALSPQPEYNHKTASSNVLHRGITLEIPFDDLQGAHERGGMGAVHKHIADVALQGHTRTRRHKGDPEEPGLGTHWTSDRSVATKFAQGTRFAGDYDSVPRAQHDGYGSLNIPVVMHAHIAPEHHDNSDEGAQWGQVQGRGWNGIPIPGERPEAETLVRRGAPVNVTHIEAALPKHDWSDTLNNAYGWHDDEDKVSDHEHSWQQIHGPVRHTAIHEHIIDPFEPTERLFAPTKDHLDETLFDEQERMRPKVRKEILKVTDHFFDTHGYTGHERWARVFLAGSQASYWGGNHDFDLLIGINYPIFRQAHPELDHLSDAEVDRRFNEQLRDDFNMDGWRPSFDPHGEPWDRTGYVNHASWNIADIKPYAAYNVTDDVWAVRPIKEPEGHEFVTTEWYYFEGVAAQILAAMKLQEPARTQTLTHIWDWVHGDRSRAFGPNGTGAFDRSNALEKYLSQYPAPGHPDGVYLMDLLRDAKYGLQATASRVAMAAADDDWRMQHRPPGRDGIPLHDMTVNLPADVYTHPHYYADMSDPSTQDSVSTMRRVRGKPDAKVKVYRALPAEHAHKGIGPGDWVTTSKEYARIHGRQSDPKHDWPVISATVKAGDLHTDGDDFREYGYNGDKSLPGNIAHKGGYHQEVSQKADGTISPVVRRSQSPVKGYDVRHDPQGFDDFIAGRGGVTAYDTQGNYAGHMRWDEDGVFSQNVHEDHQHVADHLIRKMRQQLPKIHRQAALSSDQPITKRANSDGPSTVEDDPARWGVGGWRDRDMSQSKLRETHTGSDGYTYHHAPGSLNGDDEGYGSIYVTHGDDPHNVVGESYYGPHSSLPERLELASRVAPDHRRRGVATGMYDFAERLTGKQTAPADSHSDQAAAFWSHRRASRGHDGIITHDGKAWAAKVDPEAIMQKPTPREAALSSDWEISRKRVPTGGSKFGERYELSAMDSDGKRQGWVRYHEPKRKGSPMHVEEVRGDVPGVASHLLNHMESLHPNASRTVFLNDDTKRDKNTPSHTGGDHGKPTDWDQHYDSIGDLHRGFSVRMSPSDARKVNSADRAPEDHVKTLLSQIGGGRAGTHWTSGLRESQNFSQRNQSDPRTDIPVILHAQKPERKDIETRPSELFRHGVFPYDHVEKEVPIRKGRDVVLTGMSWKPDVAHPDADEDGWLHHTFTEPFTKSASLESVASFDPTGEQGWSEIRRQGGANGDLPEGLHFTHGTHEDLPRKYPWIVRPGEHAVRAHVGDKIIGHVKWQSEDAIKGNRKAGWINELGVDSDYHRRGVGSALVDKAKEIDPRVHISTDLTDDGKAWAKGYQGRTASAGDVQYISHQELRNMYSGDYDAPMGKAHGSMLRDWRDYKNGELDQDDIHSGELEHGGPTAHIRHLQDDIAQNGLKDPLVIRGGNVVVDGNHRGVAALNLRLDKIPVRHVAHRKEGSDDMATKSAYATGQRRIAMPWFNNDDGVNPSHAKSVRDAGYAGYVGDSERDEELGHGGYGGHEDEFDEDLWDHVAPHPTHEEKRHMDEHGEYPDSYHERHDEAYGEAQHRKAQEDEMDHDDPDLHHFIGEHGSNAALWKEKGTFGKVNIKDQPVYATQSHVNQQHIDHYTASPGDISHSMRNTPGYGEAHKDNPYLADEHPMFVTHEGRLHVTDGHHRVAAALQSGQKHIMGWHYDGDEHGFPDEDEDDWGHHTSSRAQRRPESSSLSAYAKLVLADSTFMHAMQHQRQVEDEETRTREGVTHAGLIVKANDTGRVVVLQRSYKDEEDPARGMLEFPGGGIEPGESAYQAACREWQEETGAHLPEGDPSGSFISNGLYKGFIMVVPSEDDVDIHEAAVHGNPDDPFRLDPEVVMWIDIEHLADGPATRDEVKTGTDWDMLRRAAL